MLATNQSRTFFPLVFCLKSKNQNKQNYNIVFGSAWAWNLFSDIKGRQETKGV
jgi:hypothetical protein